VVRGIDLLGFFYRSMVEPQNDIAIVAITVVEVWSCNRYWLICFRIEDCKRAGRIEANTTDCGWIYVVL
jgi:hypothetical protein